MSDIEINDIEGASAAIVDQAHSSRSSKETAYSSLTRVRSGKRTQMAVLEVNVLQF